LKIATPSSRVSRLVSLRRELIGAGIAIAVIILAIVGIVLILLRNQTIENSDREMATVSRVTAERTSQTLAAADVLIRSIADTAMKPGPGEALSMAERAQTEAFHETLFRLQKLLPEIDVAAVIDANGDVIGSSREYPVPKVNLANVQFFATLKKDPGAGLIISEPIQSRITGNKTLYLARSMVDADGRFQGIVMAGVSVNYFQNYFSGIDLGATLTVTLVNKDLLVMARWPDPDGLVGQRLPPPTAEQNPSLGATVRFVVPDRDREIRRVVATRFEIDNNPLFLAISRTQGAVLQPWRSALVFIILFAATSLVVLGVLAVFVLRAIRHEESWGTALMEREVRLSRQAIELAHARDVAETANRARGEFMANMSHELRTPLNAILGFSEILERGLFGPLGDPRYREFAADIHASGKHLLEVIGNILDLAKVDAGKLELFAQDFDIVEMIQSCGRLMSEAANAGGVSFEVLTPRSPVLIQGDATRIRQILLNLLSNAVKFTPRGKSVTLAGEPVEDGFIVRVTDTGIGMTDDEAMKAMEPFHQIDSSLARRYQGTGLGLPLTKSLVTLHEGEMDIKSVPGEGTTVTVWLPRQQASSAGNVAA
jgi:signal transduction histidine kinase